MTKFIKAIFFDLTGRIEKMLEELASPKISKEIDPAFLQETERLLLELKNEIAALINSGDLEIEALASNNVIKYNTLHEGLLTIELFRYLIIINYGDAEEYFKKKIKRIYTEINCLQNPPIITTISNSENYYWALPSYDIIAVPTGEERSLLNLPDLYHEMGHLIYNQYAYYLKGSIEQSLKKYYADEIQRVVNEQRSASLIPFFREKLNYWIDSWVMEFTCDMIAVYLVGPAYAWTNLKLTTLSSGKDQIYLDSPSHPSDEARMRAIFYLLEKMGHTAELAEIKLSWDAFLNATANGVPQNYAFVFPQIFLQELADNVLAGCQSIDLKSYQEQIALHGNPVSKILNAAWEKLFVAPAAFHQWEKEQIEAIKLQA